jgi:hypothetical protein
MIREIGSERISNGVGIEGRFGYNTPIKRKFTTHDVSFGWLAHFSIKMTP